MDTDRVVPALALAIAGGQRRDLAALRCHVPSRSEAPDRGWWEERGRAAGRLKPRLADRLRSNTLPDEAQRALERSLARGDRVLGPDELDASAAWGGLLHLPEGPLVLFVAGDLAALDESPRLAVVGSRSASAYGLRSARRLASGAAEAGVLVLSGAARGIDGAAHHGALDANAPTVAVLGAGLDVPYPPEHAGLCERIVGEGGLLLSEYAPGTGPRAHHFPRRNRLLVALSDVLLLVESRIKSGSLTSVRWALDLGREVLVVPGPIDAVNSEGPIALLREGAVAVGGVSDLLTTLGLDGDLPDLGGMASAAAGDCVGAPSKLGEHLLTLLGSEALALDRLVRLAAEAPGRVLTELLALEERGLVRSDGHGRFTRSN